MFIKDEEMKNYFRSEYKNDHEIMYYAYVEDAKRARNKAIINFFSNIFKNIFVKKQLSPMEEYFSKADSMIDLENRQREWVRNHSHNDTKPIFA